jgi:fumarate reductase flavoprotein subunit
MARDYDVIVVGSGAAGLAAAIGASDAGASVLVIEADTRVGGSSRLSGGHFYAAGTSVQRAAGITDDADAMFEHYMTLNQWLVEPSVVRRYCDLSAPAFEWLMGLGVEFLPERVYRSGVGSVARGHPPEGGGVRVIEVLHAQLDQRPVDFVLNARVTRLLADEEGAVCGIQAGDDAATCGAVVMATGGFGANRELLARYYPEAAKADNWSWYIGTPLAQGDGLFLGQAVGADIAGFNRGLLLVTPGFSRDLEVLLPGWLVIVNPEGRRFANETAPYSVLGGLIQQQGGHAFAVFDEAARQAARPTPTSQAYWVDEVLAARADEGRIARADSLAELAAKIGADPAVLEGSISRYNADAARGVDSVYFKDPATGMRPLASPPFYAAELRPAIICWTGAGLRIDADTRVLRRDERPVPGLFAAGETVGSLHGDRYIGGGGSFGPCIAFGKLAGENAAAHARVATER